MKIQRIAGALGAELLDIDLSAPLTDVQVAEIRQALLDHCVIFFRDQTITPDQQVAFARAFGEIVGLSNDQTAAKPPRDYPGSERGARDGEFWRPLAYRHGLPGGGRRSVRSCLLSQSLHLVAIPFLRMDT